MKETCNIKGMDCVSCAQVIKNTLEKMPGVQECEINFVTKKANIQYDEEKIQLQQMKKELKKHGYELESGKEQKESNTTKAEQELHEAKEKLYITIPLVILTILIMIWMIWAGYGWREKNEIIDKFFHHLLPIFATMMFCLVGQKYLSAIWKYFRYGTANMDTLVGLGTSVAFIYSFIVSAFSGPLEGIVDTSRNFYEAVIIVIGFIEIGKYMETKVMAKTGKAIKALLNLQAKEAIIKRDGKEIRIPIQEIIIGDTMIVKAGEKIPLDGEITSWEGYIDESMLTGESLPILKKIWDKVIGSTIVSDASLEIKVIANEKDSYLQKIIHIVEEAQNSKPQIQKLADKIMKYFIPGVLTIAILAAVFWLFFGKQFFPEINNIQFSIMSFVGVLVIACPCGIGLATPMAIITGIGHGAKNGILAKNAEGLLKLRKSTLIVFDKTGTITQGKPSLVESSNPEYLSLLWSLEKHSSHPIAHAIVEYNKKENIEFQEVKNFKNLNGIGIQGEIDNRLYKIVKPAQLTQEKIIYDEKLINKRTSQGKTPLILIQNEKVLWYYAVADTIKPQSKQAIEELKKQGIAPIMITWDHKNTANYIAKEVGIDRIYAEIKPEEKATIIKELQKEGIVTMVGDGINDAPALATADIGIAMSTGTDAAIESAEITLLHGDLTKLLKAIKISKLTQTAILQNLGWAFGFNLIGIPLAAGVFYPLFGILLNPAFEWAAMAFSDLMVVGNSLRLQTKKI